jgi:ribonucleoside-triphosphate reductase
MTQIIAAVASSQYGGQSVAIKHLGKYLRKSRNKYLAKYKEKFPNLPEDVINELVNDTLKQELSDGVQTMQYQINTLMTTNGQSPFVTIFMQIEDGYEYEEEVAMIVEEILKQRIQGIKNEKGVYVTPAFPKLIYVLDENNCLKGGKYDYITKLAVQCSAKRLYPDYISAKKMRENYEGNVFSCMGCRSFLSTWKDENGNYKWEGRFNQGVVSLNLPQIGIIAKGDEEMFWQLLEERLSLCFEALMCRHRALEGTLSNVSPIHWQYGAIARLEKGQTIDKLLHDGYSTISLGYIGLYEVTKLMKGVSHTDPAGTEFALKVMKRLRKATDTWKENTGIGFGLYGTPAESLCYRFARIDKERFGEIEDITDKGYYTNSYHVDVREKIDAFEKFTFESQFQNISSGGAISYVEIPNMRNNLEALEEVVKFIYDNIQYAEFNTKSDYCHECGYDGEIIINDKLEWECPQCHNKDHSKMNVTRRTCGYLGENFWNVGKTKEINSRVLHM